MVFVSGRLSLESTSPSNVNLDTSLDLAVPAGDLDRDLNLTFDDLAVDPGISIDVDSLLFDLRGDLNLHFCIAVDISGDLDLDLDGLILSAAAVDGGLNMAISRCLVLAFC